MSQRAGRFDGKETMRTTLNLDQKIAIVRGTPLFSGLTDAELQVLAGKSQLLQLAPREPLFFRGDPGDRLYIVVQGIVRICSVSDEGHEVTLNLMTGGQMFGEIAALDGSERTADALAFDEVLLLTLQRQHLVDFLRNDPEACLRLVGAMCDRLRWVSGLLEDANFLDIPARLAKRLVMLGFLFGTADDSGKTQVNLRLSQQELANMVSATRESVNKFLRRWEEDGAIAYDRGTLTILDQDYLAGLF